MEQDKNKQFRERLTVIFEEYRDFIKLPDDKKTRWALDRMCCDLGQLSIDITRCIQQEGKDMHPAYLVDLFNTYRDVDSFYHCVDIERGYTSYQ